jgi:hypothetical protein
MAFETFVLGCWNGGLCWKGVCYNIKEKRIMRKRMCISV